MQIVQLRDPFDEQDACNYFRVCCYLWCLTTSLMVEIVNIHMYATPLLPQHLLPRAEQEPTVALWPTAGRALGLSRSSTYAAARRGQVPGLIRIGGRYRVATAELRRALGLDIGNHVLAQRNKNDD